MLQNQNQSSKKNFSNLNFFYWYKGNWKGKIQGVQIESGEVGRE